MYCNECGQTLEKDALFCNNCGSKQDSPEQSDNEHKITNKIFHCKDEALIDTLGSGYINSLFVQKKFSKSILFCSDKRVYQTGKIFERNYSGRIIYYNGEKCVGLREITGIGFVIENPITRLIFVFATFILGMLGFSLAEEQFRSIQDILLFTSPLLIVISIISLILYFLKKAKWLVIEYAGGMIMTNCNWYSKTSIKNFMKNISIQKDKVFE